MTGPDPRFGKVMAGSLAAHALLLLALAVLPAGGGAPAPIPIYTIKIVESPQVPEARALDLSPALRRELHLESPTLTLNAPPLPTAPAPDVMGQEIPTPPRAAAPLPRQPTLTAPPAGTAPPDPKAPGLVLPAPPALPQPPVPRTQRQSPAPGAVPPPPGLAASAAQPPAIDAPSAEERLRTKVQNLNLKVESAEPAPGPAAAVDRERSLIPLRLFQNTVRERVKKAYTFPGSFAENLHARVRVVLLRSGELQSAEILESSGNDRFDKLVCMAAIRNAKYPSVPDSVEGPTHTLFLTCSP